MRWLIGAVSPTDLPIDHLTAHELDPTDLHQRISFSESILALI
jgi:hypothetical protein